MVNNRIITLGLILILILSGTITTISADPPKIDHNKIEENLEESLDTEYNIKFIDSLPQVNQITG